MLLGKKIGNDRYEIITLVAEGGMSYIYRGYDEVLDRDVAIKVLKPEMVKNEKHLESFRAEANIILGLAHKNIREVYDFIEEDGITAIIMEYVKGKNLKEFINTNGFVKPETAVDIIFKVSRALHHAHSKGVIHKDVKPQNVILDDNNNPKVADFGIAELSNVAEATDSRAVMGSIYYISPEQVQGKKVDEKSDIYSLGIILFEMLTGELPFNGSQPVDIAMKHIDSKFPSVREFNSAIPQALENVIYRSTSKSAEYRHLSAEDFSIDVKTSLSEERAKEVEMPFIMLGIKDDKNNADLEKTMVMDLSETKIPQASRNATDQKKDEINDKKDGRKKRTTIITIVAILIILVILAIFMFGVGASMSQMPYINGMMCDDAFLEFDGKEFTLDESNFIVEEKIDAEGCIVSATNTPPGTEVTNVEDVLITLEIGVEGVEIQNFVGKNISEAQTQLESLGINVINNIVYNSSVPDGQIVSQSINGGEKVKVGETITFESAKPEKVTTTDLVGKDRNYASTWAEQNGVVVEYTNICDIDVADGNIVSQSISVGTQIEKGEKITLEISDHSLEDCVVEEPEEELPPVEEEEGEKPPTEEEIEETPPVENPESVFSWLKKE